MNLRNRATRTIDPGNEGESITAGNVLNGGSVDGDRASATLAKWLTEHPSDGEDEWRKC